MRSLECLVGSGVSLLARDRTAEVEIVALAEFQRLVAAGQIHYFAGANQASFGDRSGPAARITAWVRAHFSSRTVGGVTVYDLAHARS